MATPVVPPEIKVLSHDKPYNRLTWSVRGQEGWVIGPSLEHYRCIKYFFPPTRSVRDVDTVTYFSRDITIPKVNLDELLRQAATDISTILTVPHSKPPPSLQTGDPTHNTL